MMRALVVNAYDMGNWGDTAITEGLIHTLRCTGYDHVTVAPVDWDRAADAWRAMGANDVVRPLLSMFDGVPLFGRARPAVLARVFARIVRHATGWATDRSMAAYREADLVVSTGGGWLGGSKPGPNLIKAGNIRAGVIAGRPTVVAPVSVNPMSSSVRKVVRWGLADVPIFVRERPSLGVLRGAGLGAQLVPDLAFRAPTLLSVSRSVPPPSRRTTQTIGWAPRGYRAEHRAWGNPVLAEARTLEAVRELLRTSDDRLLFVPHVRAGYRDDDSQTVERLLQRFSREERRRVDVHPVPTTLADAVRQYALVDVLISSRMHAAIFAMAVGTPAVAIGYEPKVAGVMAGIGLSDRVVPADGRLDASSLVELIQRLRLDNERRHTIEAFALPPEDFGPLDAALRTGRAR